MNSVKILIVDDEIKILQVLKSYLENNGYEVYEAQNGKEAIEKFDRIGPSLLILDLMLPDITGEEICRIIRKKSRVPIIMLTAKVEEDDLIKGFNIGADDYITKPFSPREVAARVIALLRRTEDEIMPLSSIMSFNDNDLVMDSLKHQVKKKDVIVNLTPKEYKILMIMAKYPKKAFTREELVIMALGDDYEGFDRVIDTHIKNIRQKIETNPKEPKYILTIHGIGYRFGDE